MSPPSRAVQRDRMISLSDLFNAWKRRLSGRLRSNEITTPDGRRRAHRYMYWFDFEIFRRRWSNLHQIAPGVWRANQPTEARYDEIAALGVRTILNLRGAEQSPYWLFESEHCARLGIRLVGVAFKASHAPARERMLELIEIYRQIETPFLLHCKSGADRAGLASAIYLLAIEGSTVEAARAMLSLRFLHVRYHTTGVLDLILDHFAKAKAIAEAQGAGADLTFEAWVRDYYDAEAIQAEFTARPLWRRADGPGLAFVPPKAAQ